MSLEHAILGFLQYKPLSGYDLKSYFDMSVRHFWTADQSQIYRTLSKLSDGGLTEVEVVEQDDRPDRKVYHITDKGREELLQWLSTPMQCKNERVAVLIQVFFAGHLSDDEALAIFRSMAERSRQSNEMLRQLPKPENAPDDEGLSRDAFFWGLTLDYGIRMTEASAAWAEGVIARLERGEHNGTAGSKMTSLLDEDLKER